MNLVANASDAMPTGGTLTLHTANGKLDLSDGEPSATPERVDAVILTVTDTGVGLDEQTQAHIFDPFFTTKDIGKGTGLGLATVYGIARQSGGFIRVDSAPGRGATFTFCLPAEQGPSDTAGEPHVAPQAQVAEGSETVLVVEDDEGVRLLVRHILTQNGYTVLHAADGDEALRACDTHPGEIHLVLTDALMPGISGLELIDQVVARRPGAKLLVMSGYNQVALEGLGLANTDAAFIPKPFTSAELTHAARSLLDV